MATTIQVKEATLERLKYFKNYSKESYDEIINKLINEIEEGELTDEALKDIIEAKKEIREGKGQKMITLILNFFSNKNINKGY